MKFPSYKNIGLALLFSFAASAVSAKVTLPSFFTDNMVLQQTTGVPLWGQAKANATVKVTTSWDKKDYSVKADAKGNFTVSVKTPAYGGPYTITFNDGEVTELKNILIGEVWLCSGQSNMEMPLSGWGKINNFKEEIANANYPEIRLIQADHIDSSKPQTELKVQHGGWQVCSPETIADFSSTAYFFARKIYQEKHIPIGLIHSSWGGTYIEAWTSSEALKTIHDFDEAIASMQDDTAKAAMQKKYDEQFGGWLAGLNKADKGMQGDKAAWAQPGATGPWKTMKLPVFWENAGLPDFDGAVWFRKNVIVPDGMKGQDIELEFYADDDDKVWVNGTLIGSTVGYNIQRHYTIPAKILKPGENTIVIRVYDGSSGGGIYGTPEELNIKAGAKTLSIAGDWEYAVGVSLADLPAAPYIPQGQHRPSALFNAMINPLLKYKIKGVIWYQGENNAERAYQYQTLFPLLIKDWRRQFDNKDMPFYYVQLANFKQPKAQPGPSSWAELREAQFKTLSVPNTGMAVITDIGDADDIHPKNKQEVGERLALIALAKTYGVKVDYSGPLYKSFSVSGNTLTVAFTFSDGLKAKSGTLKGFTIAGADKVFYPAEAKLNGNVITVTSDKVKNPVAVRYNWADNPDGNLTNASGLPASSFRTDTWEGMTFGKK
jgi:sialate O-acetylesterase